MRLNGSCEAILAIVVITSRMLFNNKRLLLYSCCQSLLLCGCFQSFCCEKPGDCWKLGEGSCEASDCPVLSSCQDCEDSELPSCHDCSVLLSGHFSDCSDDCSDSFWGLKALRIFSNRFQDIFYLLTRLDFLQLFRCFYGLFQTIKAIITLFSAILG